MKNEHCWADNEGPELDNKEDEEDEEESIRLRIKTRTKGVRDKIKCNIFPEKPTKVRLEVCRALI